MRRALLAAAIVLALAPVTATAQDHHGGEPHAGAISIGFADFDPAFADVLTGDSIRWTNDSVRRHDVAAVDGAFNSGSLGAGAMFSRTFATAGDVAYFCTIHPFMRGVVSVHDLLLDVPREPGVPGRPFPLRGRSALPAGAPIAIEADDGAGFVPVASTTVQDDGTFAADLRPHAPAQLRAVSGAAASPPVNLLVIDRAVTATAHAHHGRVRVHVRVTPPGHGMVMLQLRLRERFGWWPVRHAELDHHGHATFSVRVPRRRVRARVVLTLADGATPLAVSPELKIGR